MRTHLFFAAICSCLASAMVAASATAAPTKPSAAAQQFEDRPEPLVPKQPRTEAQEDRLEAAALFASGRTMEQRQHEAEALKLYERAARLDPLAVPVLKEIYGLALVLNRRSEALRYYVKLGEQDSSDPVMLRRIGLYLTDEGDWKQASGFLERSLKIEEADPKPTLAQTVLRVDLARLDFLNGRYAEAAALFDKVLPALDKPKDFGLDDAARKTLIGDDGLTYELMGAAFLEANRPEDAAKAFAKLNEITPNPGVLALNMARVEAKSKHPAEALAKLQTYFDSHPAELNFAALELLAAVLTEQKQADQLLPRLEKLRAANADSAVLNFFLAEQYRKAGKPAEAAPLYEAVLKKKPTAEAYRALVAIYRQTNRTDALLKLLGDVVVKTGSFDALDADAKSLVADDKLVAALFKAARTDHAAAKEADYPSLRAAAALASERKQFDVAEEFYNLALKAAPAKDRAEILLAWGIQLFAAEKNAEAVKVFERGVREGKLPDDKPAFEYYLCGALEFGGQTDAALAVAHKMLETKKPKETRYAARAAWILYHAKRYDEAYKTYQELLAKFDADYDSDENRDALREARSALSNICVERHKLPEAEEWLQQVLDEFPDDIGAQNDLGYLWADQAKHLQRALAMIQRAVAAEPDNAAYRDSLGWVFFRLGRPDEAIAELKKAVAGDDPDGTIIEHLGDVYDKMNQPQPALENWNRALKSYEKQHDDEKIKAIREKIARRKNDE